MNDLFPTDDPAAKAPPSKALSPRELASFLSQLAALYSSRSHGNLPLAAALRDLASAVRNGGLTPKRSTSSKVRPTPGTSLPGDDELRVSKLDAIRKYLSDEKVTKTDLLRLAAARFSMPISQLKRMRIEDLREAIRGAMLHENSLDILTEEAHRHGTNRNS